MLSNRIRLYYLSFSKRLMSLPTHPSTVSRLLITLGGADQRHVAKGLLEGLPLERLPHLAVTLVVGAACPGIGDLTVDAISGRDFPVVQACVLMFSLSVVIANTGVDIVYTYVDPRLRAE